MQNNIPVSNTLTEVRFKLGRLILQGMPPYSDSPATGPWPIVPSDVVLVISDWHLIREEHQRYMAIGNAIKGSSYTVQIRSG